MIYFTTFNKCVLLTGKIRIGVTERGIIKIIIVNDENPVIQRLCIT